MSWDTIRDEKLSISNRRLLLFKLGEEIIELKSSIARESISTSICSLSSVFPESKGLYLEFSLRSILLKPKYAALQIIILNTVGIQGKSCFELIDHPNI